MASKVADRDMNVNYAGIVFNTKSERRFQNKNFGVSTLMANKPSLNWERNMSAHRGGCETNWMSMGFPCQQRSFRKPPSSCPTPPFGVEAMVFVFFDLGISNETFGGMKCLVKKSPTITMGARFWKQEVGCSAPRLWTADEAQQQFLAIFQFKSATSIK